MTSPTRLTIGTRGSPLALAQTEGVRRALAAACGIAPEAIEIRVIKTTGDRVLDRPLAEIGGKGLFTKEIEDALLDGSLDLAVHSMKDMPTVLPDGLVIDAVPERADPRDVLLSPLAARIADLPPGTVVGTASLRRGAQLLYRRPDLKVVPLRGNVQTRLRKLEEGAIGATLLAAAGLDRLGLGTAGGTLLEPDEMLPAVAQGALAIECREDDLRVRELLARLDHEATRICVTAERAFLATLDGSCRTPIAALAVLGGGEVRLDGLVARPDGSAAYAERGRAPPEDAADLGAELGTLLRDRAGPGFLEA
jgi:hydroxymethylbilane synthase